MRNFQGSGGNYIEMETEEDRKEDECRWVNVLSVISHLFGVFGAMVRLPR